MARYWADSTGRRNTLTVRSCDGNTQTASVGSGGSVTDAFTWSAAGGAAWASAAVLEGDRARAVQRGRRRGVWRIAGGGGAVVPAGWRHAIDQSGSAVGPLPVVHRARRDHRPQGPRLWRARDRSQGRPFSVDHLARGTPQRRDPWRPAGVSSHDRAVARGSACQAPEGGQARRQRPATPVRAGPARRQGHRARRRGGARTRGRGKQFLTPEILISQRPAEVADRAVPGHWEGDLILGLGSSAIGTLVERTTRFTMLLHLPRMHGHGDQARVHNGPALAGPGAEAVRDAIAASIVTLPQQLRRSLTWDQGAELAQHAQLRIDTGLQVFFCDPHSPWQRGTNENTN